jgi:autotransporter-associated beta strand protein
MNVVLGNTAANVVSVDGSGNIVISSVISTVNTSKPLTFAGVGSGRVDITNTANTFIGNISVNGAEVRFTTDGSLGNAGNTLTIDGGRLAIVSGGAVTIASTRNIAVGGSAGTSISAPGATGVLTYNGVVADKSGSTGVLVKQGAGILSFGGASTYSGATSINNGAIQLTTGSNRLPIATVVNFGQAGSSNLGVLDLNGFDQQIAGLSTTLGTATTGTNSVTSSTAATLTISGTGSNSFGSISAANPGTITGSISIVKAGTGTQTFGGSAAYTYTGTTTISGGILQLGNANVLPAATAVTLNGGTLSTGASTGFSQSVGTLNVAANSTIALGTGNHTLTFAASNGVTWNGTTLTVTGWTGTAGSTGTAGRFFVGNSATSLTAAQLAKITFSGYSAGATQLSTGEVVPAAPTCPSITTNLGSNATICAGSVADLTTGITGGTGPYSLTYSDGTANTVVSNYTSGANIAVSPTANTTYTLVNVTDVNSCAATVSGSAQITVNQNPTTANAGPAQTIFTGQATTLAANAPTTGTGMWSVTSGPSTATSQFSDVTSSTATFTPTGDVGDYVLTWTISNAPCTPSTSNVTVTVNKPTVNLSVSSNSGSEAAQTAITVTATASAPVVGDQTVDLAVSGTGITSGDYTLSNTTITILNGQTVGSVIFTITDDNAVEGTETATLTISNPSTKIALGSTTAQTITITDNDVAPGLSINDVSMMEGNAGTTEFTFTVSLATPAPAGGVSFDYTTANGTAIAGSDYVPASGTRTILEGQRTATLTVLINGNTTYEPDKTFFINVSNVTGATVSKAQGTGTIQNDDAQPLPDLTVALSGPASATTGQAYSYSLVVSNSGTATANTVSVSFALPTGVIYASATGSNGFAATQSGSTVSFTGGSLTQGSSVTLTVSVTPSTTSTETVSPGDAVVDPLNTIVESNETNNSSTQTVTTTVVAPNQPPVAPTLPNQSGTVAVALTYTVPVFTDPENGTLTYVITGVPAGLTVNNSTRVISGTPTTTGISTVTVVATDPQSATTEGTFTITINANQPPVVPTFVNQTATVGTAFSYVVPVFSDAENQPLTYAATGFPSPLSFDPVTRTLSGTPTNSGTSTITITATDPANNMTDGTFTLTVSSAPGQIRITEFMYSGTPGEYIELTNVGGSPVDLTGWAFNDNTTSDTPNSLSGLGVVQPGQSVVYTEADPAAFRKAWFLPASIVVAGPYATNNLGRSGEVNIFDASGTLVQKLVYGDNMIGGVRTQNVSAYPSRANLNNANAAAWTASAAGDAQYSYSSATGNIGNPGGYFVVLPRVKVVESGGTTTVTEGGATDTYTVALNSQPSSDVTVTINAGSQLTVNPATLTFTSANFTTAQTVTVTAIDDNMYQGTPRSVTITQNVTSSDAAYNSLVANPVSVTIIDNDTPVTAAPTIQVAGTTTQYLSLPINGPGYVSGVIGDPTDPASTLGIDFTLADTDTDVNTLTATASSNNGNATVSLTGSGSSRNLKITPVNVGYATVTVSVGDGANTTNYVVNYAASAASVAPGATRFLTGTSDASTAVLVDANNMLVADDENQVLRLYNRQNSGLPIAGFDFTSSLGLTDVSGGVPREVDLELSVRQNNRIFWLGSQSNADGGNARVNRDRVFATDVSGSGVATTLSYVGRYDFLREDIISWDVNNSHGKGANYYGLQASATAGVGSKQSIGYNIEGAEFAPDGTTVYLGFRAPQTIPANRTKALIIPVTNLTSLISGQAQGAATFGAPIELNLGGRGIREIRKNSANQYVIIAGPAGDAGASPNDFRLFTWTGNASDAPVERNANLTALNASGSFESIVEVPASLDNNTQLQLLVDNGDAVYYNDGTIAKELSQNNFKKFRSDIVTVGSPLNTAPVAVVNGNQTATVGTAFTYTVNAFTDAETPNNLTYAAIINPVDGLSFDPATRIIAGTPTMSGVSSVTITATDPGSLSASTTFTITVNPAPVTALTVTASASPTQLLTSAGTTLTGMAMGGTSPYSYAFSGPGTIVPNGNTATVSGLSAGVQTFTVTATDAASPSQSLTSVVSVTVTMANTAPTVANMIAPQSATVGAAYTLSLANVFTDAETPNQLTLTVSGLPSGLRFVAPATISGNSSLSGTGTISVTATDPDNLSASTSFVLTIAPAPVTALTVTASASPTQITTNMNAIITAQVSGGMAPYSYFFSGPGTVMYIGNTASVSSLSAGVQTFTVTVSDATTPTSQTASATVSVTVTQGNRPPMAISPIPNYTVTVGQSFSLDASKLFVDPDGDPITITVGALPPGISFYNDVLSGKPTQAGAYTIDFLVYDASSVGVSRFTLTVVANTSPTVANAVSPQSATVGMGYTLSVANVFTDAETPNQLTLVASGLPMGLSLNGTTISGTPSMSGVSSVTLTATDPGSMSTSTTFTLSVNPASTTPPTGPFSITGVTLVSCTTLSVGERQISFTPQYAGVTGESISFRVVNESVPTTMAGPYTLKLYTDNPVINLRAMQGRGSEVAYAYNWLSACNTTTPTNPTNTAPTVANAVSPQSATVGMGYTLSVANVFTDAETPNQLTLVASGLPMGLSLNGTTISGTPSMSGVSSVTLTATDPGSMSTSTTFTLSVNPASTTPPTGPFSITGVTLVSCTTLSVGERQISFSPQYAGQDGSPVSFSVVNESVPTTMAGPYSLKLYTDNPLITLSASQGGTTSQFGYNWLSACNNVGTTPPPTNTAPTVANAVGPQSATVGSGYTLSVANVFTDAETPNQLALSVSGLPAGLSLNGTTISGTPSMSGVSSVTITATDPGSLSTSTTFMLSVSPTSTTAPTPTGPFSITGVTLVSCTTDGPGARLISFTPQYAGLTGESIRFRVVNESLPTTAAGPYNLRLYTDNPVINLRAAQGNGSEVTYAYNWLAACNVNSRVATSERTEPLTVTVLGNPVVGETVDIEIRGAARQAVRIQAVDSRGYIVSDSRIGQAADIEKTTVLLRGALGVYLLQISTATQQQTVKLIRE